MLTKTALITGAAGGIGRAMVKEFAMAGYMVIATDCIEKPEGLECACYLQLDLAQFVESKAIAEQALLHIKAYLPAKRLDVLINNAALQILGGADSLTRTDWHSTLTVNLLAPFMLTQGLVKELENGQGGVINIGSIHARLTKKNFVAYATSKAALAGMTRAIAIDLGPRVRINCIEPAAIETPMLKAGFAGEPNLYAELKTCHPQQSIGTPEQVACFALAISEGAFDFLNGACLSLDGGISGRLYDPN